MATDINCSLFFMFDGWSSPVKELRETKMNTQNIFQSVQLLQFYLCGYLKKLLSFGVNMGIFK